MESIRISRRDLLRLSAAGLVGAASTSMTIAGPLAQEQEPVTLVVTDLPGIPIGHDGFRTAVFQEQTGTLVSVSSSASLTSHREALSQPEDGVDIYLIDVIDPGFAASHSADLSTAVERLGKEGIEFLEASIENNTVADKVVAIPFHQDFGLLFYRKDLLDKYGFGGPPATWTELEEQAREIQAGERQEGNASFWGYVWQGHDYEGLTCNALEWQASHGGGTIIEPDGAVSINNPQSIEALAQAANWVGEISPESVTYFDEILSLNPFQQGNAAFMRNWPFVIQFLDDPTSKVAAAYGVSLLPAGDNAAATPASTIGGWQAMVSIYTEHSDEAIEFVEFAASPDSQIHRVKNFAMIPTIPSLYSDREILTVLPWVADLMPAIKTAAVARPSTVAGERYPEVSSAYSSTVHQVLAGVMKPTVAVVEIEAAIHGLLP